MVSKIKFHNKVSKLLCSTLGFQNFYVQYYGFKTLGFHIRVSRLLCLDFKNQKQCSFSKCFFSN
jgi:hypothetical protein